ncbi:MAG TPA: glycosyltransferase family 2 protein [Bryobacteraceae bacterium]|jgi:dolichol-phosphate mannosyltransferase|nr:glycosyltransferase family 2 protein [Bryobacteraceae bacterium]
MVSIVVPAYNEEDGIAELYNRIVAAAPAWHDEFELLIVDDGSRDRTLEICEQIGASDLRLKVISLSRNFGHQAAVSAGLMHARGNIVVVMDADLQDPPEELRPFIEKIHEGWDVVYAIRTKRKEGLIKRICYRAYYRILKRLAVLDIPLDAGDFCVMRGEVVDAINRLPERNRFVRGLRSWVGFRQTGIGYERQSRFAGEPKYNFRKLFRLALDGIINFSYRPLQFIMSIGLALAGLCMLGAIFVVIQYVADWTIAGFNPRAATGWTSLIFALLFFSAVNLVCMGILGEYIGRLFEEVKHRPVWIVKKRVNLAGDS